MFWAMLRDPDSLPPTIIKHMQITWWKDVVIKLRQAMRNEEKSFIYFPSARSHKPLDE